MPVLPQLKSPNEYSPNTFPYIPKQENDSKIPPREEWIQIFKDANKSFKATAAADSSVGGGTDARKAADKFERSYSSKLDRVEKDPSIVTSCLDLCKMREESLREAGFTDIFREIKQKENNNALDLLPAVLAEVDAQPTPQARWDMVIRGICAANIFDLGTIHTSEMYHNEGGVSFHATREKLVPRPWAIDCLDALIARLVDATIGTKNTIYKKALLFVDNSGADIVLGMLPFARELLKGGVAGEVVIAANTLPSINDITAAELDEMLPRVAACDDFLCKCVSSRRLRVVPSGNDLPVIDLRLVSDEVVEEAGDADFVVLEGMGRGIETNLNAEFSARCDALKIGMVKHPEVATAMNCRLLDCVVKFDHNIGGRNGSEAGDGEAQQKKTRCCMM